MAKSLYKYGKQSCTQVFRCKMLWLTLIILAVISLSLPFVYWYYLQFKFRSLRKIPGPKPIPILGNKFSPDPCESLEIVKNLKNEYGDTFKVWTGPYLHVFMTKPSDFEAVLTSTEHITKGVAYDLVRPWLGEGLLILTGDKWKHHRKIITPTFHFKILEEFMKTFNKSTNTLLEKLETLDDEQINIYEYITLHALDIICETSMGTTINAQKNVKSDYVISTRGLLNIFGERFFSSWKQVETLYKKFSQNGGDYQTFLKTTSEFCRRVIRSRRVSMQNEITNNFGTTKKRVALLDTLLKADNTITDEDIRAEIDTFLFEGHDTVSTGTSYCLYELSKNPEIQEKLYEEIVSHLGTKVEDITIAQINEMKYLDMVIKESQRKNPTVPFIERKLTSDFKIDGIVYPKDTMLTMMIYFLHLDEKYYPEPEKFDPDRFLPENVSKRHNFAYMPFSAGPRNCIGQKFAMLEMKTTVVKVLQKFKLLPVKEHVLRQGMAVTLRSFSGINIRLQKRTLFS